jgi:hypothetical protein
MPQDYRPIGLCNVIYKIISKSVANRVKGHLTNYISYSQAAFVAGRHIFSNIIITQEIIHSFNLKSWSDHAFILKLDLANRIERSFISTAMHRIGFTNHFINLIQTCVSTSSLAILVNDEPTAYFHPQRGLRQGCPLSTYLFVLAINELCLRLQEALQNNNLSGVSLGPGAPPIYSLLFADDLILCGKATLEEAHKIKDILDNICQQSGQTPNLQNHPSYSGGKFPAPSRTRSKVSFFFPLSNPIPCI